MNLLINALFLISLVWTALADDCTAWGTRISLGNYYTLDRGNTQLVISFNTDSECPNNSLNLMGTNYPCTTVAVSKPALNFQTFTHNCEITSLKYTEDHNKLNYTIVDNNNSTVFGPVSTCIVNRDVAAHKWLVLGDWGLIDQTHQHYFDIIPQLQKLDPCEISYAVFLGDIAYDICDADPANPKSKVEINCDRFKPFMLAAQTFLSKIPFMVTPGNHEYGRNNRPNSEDVFNATFIVPGPSISRYSFEIGNVHFQAINFFEEVKEMNTSGLASKVSWLREDNFKTNDQHWVIPFSHYPYFCETYPNDTGCKDKIYSTNLAPVLEYFDEYKIPLVLGAHIHLYIRNYPMTRDGVRANSKLSFEGDSIVFENPSATMHVYEGSAGNSYYVQEGSFQPAKYQAATFVNTGYTIMESLSCADNFKCLKWSHHYGKDGSVAETVVIKQSTPKSLLLVYIVSGVASVVLFAIILIFIFRYRAKRLKALEQETEKRLLTHQNLV